MEVRDSFTRQARSKAGSFASAGTVCDLVAKTPVDLTDDLPELGETTDGVNGLYDLLRRLPVHQREVVAVCALLGYDYAGRRNSSKSRLGRSVPTLHRAAPDPRGPARPAGQSVAGMTRVPMSCEQAVAILTGDRTRAVTNVSTCAHASRCPRCSSAYSPGENR